MIIMEVSLHDDEAPGLITITDKNKDNSSIAFFVEQWPSIRGAVDQLAGCARTHDEVMGKPLESSDGGAEMALAQAAAYIERLQSQKRQAQHGIESLLVHLREHAEREGQPYRLSYEMCGALLKEMAESNADGAQAMSVQWIPSNGTEGYQFINDWCSRCARDAVCNGQKTFDDCQSLLQRFAAPRRSGSSTTTGARNALRLYR